jgi:hypothetical protein
LRTSSLRGAMKYAEAGLDVAFDPGSLSKYKKAANSEEELDLLIEVMSYHETMSINMDW